MLIIRQYLTKLPACGISGENFAVTLMYTYIFVTTSWLTKPDKAERSQSI